MKVLCRYPRMYQRECLPDQTVYLQAEDRQAREQIRGSQHQKQDGLIFLPWAGLREEQALPGRHQSPVRFCYFRWSSYLICFSFSRGLYCAFWFSGGYFFRYFVRRFSSGGSFADFLSNNLLRIFFRMFLYGFSWDISCADFLPNILSWIFLR